MDLIFIIILLAVGTTLIILELVAIPGTSIPGILGVGLTVWGLVKVFAEYGTFYGGIVTTLDVLFCIGLFFWSLKTKTWKKFAQKEEISSKVNEIKTLVNKGDKGVSITRLAPMGTAMINGERMEVYTSTSFVNPDTEIVVEQVQGNKIRVKPL